MTVSDLPYPIGVTTGAKAKSSIEKEASSSFPSGVSKRTRGKVHQLLVIDLIRDTIVEIVRTQSDFGFL